MNDEIPDIIINERRDRRYRKIRLLGKGGFARCYEVVEQGSGRAYAAKAILLKNINNRRYSEKLASEIRIHGSLTQENVCRLHSTFHDTVAYYLVMELCEGGTLGDVVRQRGCITEEEARYYMHQLALAMIAMREAGIVHRDLKPPNLFLSKDLNVKLGDFGLAARVKNDSERHTTMCGTPNYIAPEVVCTYVYNRYIRTGTAIPASEQHVDSETLSLVRRSPEVLKRGHTYPVDIWCFGAIIYCLVFGRAPFESSSIKQTYKRIIQGGVTFPEARHISSDCESIIRQCLTTDPNSRPTAEDLLRHPWFTNYPMLTHIDTLWAKQHPSFASKECISYATYRSRQRGSTNIATVAKDKGRAAYGLGDVENNSNSRDSKTSLGGTKRTFSVTGVNDEARLHMAADGKDERISRKPAKLIIGINGPDNGGRGGNDISNEGKRLLVPRSATNALSNGNNKSHERDFNTIPASPMSAAAAERIKGGATNQFLTNNGPLSAVQSSANNNNTFTNTADIGQYISTVNTIGPNSHMYRTNDFNVLSTRYKEMIINKEREGATGSAANPQGGVLCIPDINISNDEEEENEEHYKVSVVTTNRVSNKQNVSEQDRQNQAQGNIGGGYRKTPVGSYKPPSVSTKQGKINSMTSKTGITGQYTPSSAAQSGANNSSANASGAQANGTKSGYFRLLRGNSSVGGANNTSSNSYGSNHPLSATNSGNQMAFNQRKEAGARPITVNGSSRYGSTSGNVNSNGPGVGNERGSGSSSGMHLTSKNTMSFKQGQINKLEDHDQQHARPITAPRSTMRMGTNPTGIGANSNNNSNPTTNVINTSNQEESHHGSNASNVNSLNSNSGNPPPPVYVVAWVDYSNRFGFGCQLSDGTVCVLLNDGTGVSASPRGTMMEITPAPSSSSSGSVQRYPLPLPPSGVGSMSNISRSVRDSCSLLIYFREYLESRILVPVPMSNRPTDIEYYSNVMGNTASSVRSLRGGSIPMGTCATGCLTQVRHWRHCGRDLVVRLSDGTVQVNLCDHTKVVLTAKHTVSLVDGQRQVRTHWLRDTGLPGFPDTALLERIPRVKALVRKLVSPK